MQTPSKTATWILGGTGALAIYGVLLFDLFHWDPSKLEKSPDAKPVLTTPSTAPAISPAPKIPAALLSKIMNGRISRKLDDFLARHSHTFTQIRPLFAARIFRLTGEIQSDIRVGRDGWLFPQSEFDALGREREGMGDEGIQNLKAVQAILKSHDVELLVAVVPRKIRIYPEYFFPSGHLPEHLVHQYSDYQEKLRSAGIPSIDLEKILQNDKPQDHSIDLLYYTGDYHWTDRGCLVAAVAVSDWIRTHHPSICDRVEKTFELKPATTIPGHDPTYHRLGFRNNELKEFFVKDSLRLEPLRLHTWKSEEIQQAPVILTGDSFAAHLQLFPSYLEMKLKAPIRDFSSIARLPPAFLDDWILAETFQARQPRVLVWLGWENNILGNRLEGMREKVENLARFPAKKTEK